MRFVDSHLHLVKQDADFVVFAASVNTLLVTCGTDQRTSQEALKLARLHPALVSAFVGVHPSEAVKSGGLKWLRKGLASATGLGEVGLDPTYSSVGPRGAQVKVLLAQLEEAQKAGKPVQVHSRLAERNVLDLLGGFRLKAVLMHWLQDEKVRPEALGRGYFMSFGPAVLYSKKLQGMAAKSPPDQVLTETDSPVSFAPLGGARGPSLVPSVVFKLAELWGVNFDDARGVLASNAMRFLGRSEKG